MEQVEGTAPVPVIINGASVGMEGFTNTPVPAVVTSPVIDTGGDAIF